MISGQGKKALKSPTSSPLAPTRESFQYDPGALVRGEQSLLLSGRDIT